jgi:uroporphyrinogen III methyltransferase/synthase
VIVTGAHEGAGRLAARLRELGCEVEERPLIRIEPIEGPQLDLSSYHWLLLTSARAVERLFQRLASTAGLPPVAVVGPGTAEALRERGVEPALVAGRATQEGLVEELRPLLARAEPPPRVLFAGAEGARDVLLRELGADFLPLYRTVEEAPADFPAGDLVVIASASAARALARLRRDLACVSIGPVTSAEAARLGLRVVAEAPTHDLDGLVEAVRLALSLPSSRS